MYREMKEKGCKSRAGRECMRYCQWRIQYLYVSCEKLSLSLLMYIIAAGTKDLLEQEKYLLH